MSESESEGRVIHPNLKLLSASSSTLLHKCPRKFQLYRLLKVEKDPDTVEPHLDFGHWVGEGIQTYFVTGDYNKALMAMFLYNAGDLFSGDDKRDNKTFWHAIIALDRFVEFRHTELQHYDVVVLDGKPAAELGFNLTCLDGFSYRGFLDLLLINNLTNELTTLECKTTKFKNVHEAIYKNSAQGLGYSLVTDIVAQKLTAEGRPVGSSWKVIYPVYKAGAMEWEAFYFNKSHANRARWLQLLLRDIQHIAEYAEADAFPMHGESCFDFFRPCEYFDLCDMHDSSLWPKGQQHVKELKDDPARYTYNFDLLAVIEAQQNKLEQG